MTTLRLLRSAALLAALAGSAACHVDALFSSADPPPTGTLPTGAQVVFTTGPTQATAGQAISPAVVVTLEDASGNAITTFTGPVTMALGTNPAGGVLTGDTTVSAVRGVATFAALQIDRAASGYTLTAAAATLRSAPSAAFTVTPGAATRLVFTVQPSSTMLDSVIKPPVQVTAYDDLGNAAANFTGDVSVKIGKDPSTLTATLGGTTLAAAVAGVATFSTLSINQLGNGYTLTAAFGSGGAPVTESAPFNITATPAPGPGSATQLAFTLQPQSASAGVIPPVQVSALDSRGAVAPTFAGPVTLTLGNNPGGDGFAGRTVNAVNGVATFSDVSIGKVGQGYTLVAVAGALTGATSQAFTISPGPATQLAFTVQPSNAAPSATMQPAVQVTAFDAFGNVATTFSGVVLLAIGHNPSLLGTGQLHGNTPPPNAVNGVATFANLSIDSPGIGYTLTAAFANGVPVRESGSFNILVP